MKVGVTGWLSFGDSIRVFERTLIEVMDILLSECGDDLEIIVEGNNCRITGCAIRTAIPKGVKVSYSGNADDFIYSMEDGSGTYDIGDVSKFGVDRTVRLWEYSDAVYVFGGAASMSIDESKATMFDVSGGR